MKLASLVKVVVLGVLAVILAMDVAAKDPIFVKWLVVDDPGDETIRTYWQRAEAGELGPEELVDLGTMLFYRGWSNDAIDYFKQALDQSPKMSEAWFRIGLVRHREGDLSGAKSAYKKCLDRQSGHGWANFYLGLLEEQAGNGKAAMEHYEMAFKHAPELADPRVNPEILSSELQLGARVRHADGERFEQAMPMPYLDPKTVRKVRRQFLPKPTPKPSSAPAAATAQPSAGAAAPGGSTATRGRAAGVRDPRAGTAAGTSRRSPAGSGAQGTEPLDEGALPYGVRTPESSGSGSVPSEGARSPQIGDTSPEARIEPLWPGLYDLVEAVV